MQSAHGGRPIPPKVYKLGLDPVDPHPGLIVEMNVRLCIMNLDNLPASRRVSIRT